MRKPWFSVALVLLLASLNLTAQSASSSVVASVPVPSNVGGIGPFGLTRGMTRAQIIATVGQSAIREEKGDTLTLTRVPKPHGEFESYVLIIAPRDGLLKIIAVGGTVENDSYGTEIRDRFNHIRDALTNVYGVGRDLDYLKSGSIWTDDRDFMMGLTKKERDLVTYWLGPTNSSDITAIGLEAKGLSSSDGYLTLGYEFRGWDGYVDGKKLKQDSVF
jgi:hypothetical protein